MLLRMEYIFLYRAEYHSMKYIYYNFFIIHPLMDTLIATMSLLCAFQCYKLSLKILMYTFSKVLNAYLFKVVSAYKVLLMVCYVVILSVALNCLYLCIFK